MVAPTAAPVEPEIVGTGGRAPESGLLYDYDGLALLDDDMLTPTGYSPPTQQPIWPTAHTAHSQHCGHTALPPGQKANPCRRTDPTQTVYYAYPFRKAQTQVRTRSLREQHRLAPVQVGYREGGHDEGAISCGISP